MPVDVGLWQIGDDGPNRLSKAAVDLEKELKDWIAQDPNLLRAGLTIVAVNGGLPEASHQSDWMTRYRAESGSPR